MITSPVGVRWICKVREENRRGFKRRGEERPVLVLNQMQASLGPSCNTKISYLSTSLGRIKGDSERGEERSQQSEFVEARKQ
jgi:hypothetical protein